MKKKIIIAVATAVMLITVSAAVLLLDNPPEAGRSADEGNTAVLFSSLAEMWIDAGGTVEITVAESVERGFVDEGTLLVDDGAGKSINTELLISYQPSLVIYSEDIPAQVQAAEMMEQNGIATLGCKVESFSDYEYVMAQMALLVGKSDVLSDVADQRAEIDEFIVAQSGKGKRILFIRTGSSISSTKAKLSEDHFACAMLVELGCENIADSAPALTETLSMEEILIQQPEAIFFSLMGSEEAAKAHIDELLDSETWSALEAVKNNKVYILPKELFHFKPNSRWAESYEYLANILEKV